MPPSTIPIETLIQQLHSDDWVARCDAARLLGQSRDPRAVDALLPDLKDSDWRVRRNAAQALGALRDRRAVEPLLQALEDRTLTVRQRAIVALGRIKDVQALPALLKIVGENCRESHEATKAVRKFGKKALPEMVKAFERTNNQQLMMLLIEMRYEGAFGLVLTLAKSQDLSTRLTGIRELGKLGAKKGIPYLQEQLKESNLLIQCEAVRALGALRAVEMIPAMLELLKENELFGRHSNVCHAVTEAFQMFAEITEEIENAFPGNYPPMFHMGGAQVALPEAMGLLRNRPSRMLIDALTKLQTGFTKPDEPTTQIMDSVRKTLDDMAWKFGVMFEDAKDAKQERVTCLIKILQSDSSLKRAAAALSLPWYTDERACAPLEQASHDSDEIVRRAARWALRALQKAISYRDQLGK
jgi:HEAT repeat protein